MGTCEFISHSPVAIVFIAYTRIKLDGSVCFLGVLDRNSAIGTADHKCILH